MPKQAYYWQLYISTYTALLGWGEPHQRNHRFGEEQQGET